MAMIVDRTCSLTVKWPGFSECPKTDTFGMKRAHTRPTGKMSSWATSYRVRVRDESATFSKMNDERLTPPMDTEGKRKKKNWFRPEMTIAKMIPNEQRSTTVFSSDKRSLYR